jgi:hypothetical protein
MGARKFYYGDIGEVKNTGPTHLGHLVRIASTVIRKTDNTRNNVRYTVDCECGKRLKLAAGMMEYISRPVQFPSPEEACYNSFLSDLYKYDMYGLGAVEKDKYPDRNEIDKRIAMLEPRWQDCLRRYYGLNNEGKRESLQSIGSSYGLSRERVRQIVVGSKMKLYMLHFGVMSQREARTHYTLRLLRAHLRRGECYARGIMEMESHEDRTRESPRSTTEPE